MTRILDPITKCDRPIWLTMLGAWIGVIAHTILIVRHGAAEDFFMNGLVWGAAITGTFTLYMIEWGHLTGRITIKKKGTSPS